jgi:hypothetical protein
MIAHAETAVDDWSSANEWVEYEIRLNDVLPRYDDPVICTYDANLLNANFGLDILRTHPVAIIGGCWWRIHSSRDRRSFCARSASEPGRPSRTEDKDGCE